MNWMKSCGPVLTAAAVVTVFGVAHGRWTDRWGPSEQLQRAVAALDRVPTAFGDWVGEDVPYPTEEMRWAGIEGSLFRRFEKTRTGEVVSVLIVCGRGGPISVHTPDVCYAGTGYRAVSDEATRTVSSGEPEQSFRVARFAKPDDPSKSQLEVCWAWSADGRRWEGLDAGRARLSLGRQPAVFKLYVVREFLPGGAAEQADPCGDFLRHALPALVTTAPEN